MLTLFFNKPDKKIYILKTFLKKREIFLALSSFLLIMFLAAVFVFGAVLIVNTLGINVKNQGPSVWVYVFSAMALLFFIFWLIQRAVNRYVLWYLIKYFDCAGYIGRDRNGNLILATARNGQFLTEKYPIDSGSFIKSSRTSGVYNMEIIMNEREKINLAAYWQGKGIASRRFASGIHRAQLTSSIDDLAAYLLKLGVKKEYSDEYDE